MNENKIKNTFKFLIIFFLILVIADATLTFIALEGTFQQFEEFNFIVKYFMDIFGVQNTLLYCTLITATFFVFFYYYVLKTLEKKEEDFKGITKKTSLKVLKYTVIFGVVVRIFIVASNSWNLIQYFYL